MKNALSYTLIAASLSFTACGGSNLSDSQEATLQQIRENSKLQLKNGPPQVPEKLVYVPKPVEVIKEQATLNDSYFKIDLGDKTMAFYEGQATAYKITLRVQDSDIQMKLTAKGLPTGAELKDISTAQSPNTYELRWTPALYTISYDEQPPKTVNAILVPVLVSAKTQAKANTVKGLSLERTIFFSVFRNQEKPSELTVNGLAAEIQEGQVVPFSVVAKFPGVDNNSPVKPYLGHFKDNATQVAGSNYLEMDGTRYVSVDSSRAAVEYIGDFKWKFNLVFDTKNNPVESQKAKDGSIANVNFTQTRMGMRAFGAFNSSPVSVVRVKITRTATEAGPEATAKVGGK